MKIKSKLPGSKKTLKAFSNGNDAKRKKKKGPIKNSSVAHTLPKPASTERPKFKSFVEKCRCLTANPIKFLKDQAKPSEGQTHFSATLEKWKLLNLSTAYTVRTISY